MKTNTSSLAFFIAVIATGLGRTSSMAEFSGPYALTPVTNNSYGMWTAKAAGGAAADVSDAPNTLVLAVPTGTWMATGISLQTRAVANGFVSFDASWVNVSSGGEISWFSSRSGTYVFPSGRDSHHFIFSVGTGDIFGFKVLSGSDALPPNAPPSISLTVSDFIAPVPEPGIVSLLSAAVAVGWMVRRTSAVRSWGDC